FHVTGVQTCALPIYDRDRGAPRVFRLSRIAGEVRPVGRPGQVTVPEDVDIRAMVDYQDKRLATPRTATVRVRQGTCQGLRHRAKIGRASRRGRTQEA